MVDRSLQVYIYCHLMHNITDKLISPIQVLNLLNASHLVVLARKKGPKIYLKIQKTFWTVDNFFIQFFLERLLVHSSLF